MGDWCGGDCVWMGQELERLRKLVSSYENMVNQLTKTCDELRKENDLLREKNKNETEGMD